MPAQPTYTYDVTAAVASPATHSHHSHPMTTEIMEADISTELAFRFETKKRKLQSRWVFFSEVMACLVLIVFCAGMFIAIKLCLEMGLQLATHEMTEHVRVIRGF